MDNALGDSFIQFTRSSAQFFLRLLCVALSDCFASAANVGFQFRLDSLITLTALLIGKNALLLRLDICQLILFRSFAHTFV